MACSSEVPFLESGRARQSGRFVIVLPRVVLPGFLLYIRTTTTACFHFIGTIYSCSSIELIGETALSCTVVGYSVTTAAKATLAKNPYLRHGTRFSFTLVLVFFARQPQLFQSRG